MRKALYIIGTGLIIGGTAVAIHLLSNKKNKGYDMCHDCKYPENEKPSASDVTLSKLSPNQDKPVYENVKRSAIESMYARHEGAATIIRDSVDTICENVKVSENTNNEIDKVSVELNKMLSED